MNKVILTGRLCHDPEIKYVGKNNIALVNFTLAVNRNYKNSHGDYESDFIKCRLWRKQAEIFAEYMSKGRLVYLEGVIKIDKFISSTGENKKSTIIDCDLFKFIDSKSKDFSKNEIFNGEKIFNDEDVVGNELSESEIPF